MLLTQGGFTSGDGTYFLQSFPLMILSVMISMVIVYWTRLYGKEQHGRRDLVVNTSLESGFTLLSGADSSQLPGFIGSTEGAPLVSSINSN